MSVDRLSLSDLIRGNRSTQRIITNGKDVRSKSAAIFDSVLFARVLVPVLHCQVKHDRLGSILPLRSTTAAIFLDHLVNRMQ